MPAQPPYLDRDLTWLSFNYRILEEARDGSLPLYDRIKFLAIYSSNLDEFFRVRVASLRSLSEIRKKKITQRLPFEPRPLLDQIHRVVEAQQNEYGFVWRECIMPDLRANGIVLYGEEPLLPAHEREVSRYFRSKVLSYLQPVFLDEGREKGAFLNNREIYLAVLLSPETADAGRPESRLAYLNVPSGALGRFTQLSPAGGKHYLAMLDDVIRRNLHLVFPGYRATHCHSIKLNRDAELNLEDEYTGDLVKKLRERLEKRKIGRPTRFLYDGAMPAAMRNRLVAALNLSEDDVMAGGRYHNMHDLMGLPNPLKPYLEEPPLAPLSHQSLDRAASVFSAVDAGDQLLHFPYHSYEYVLRFFNEAAIDPLVDEIKVTLYRIATDSLIANALISAAKNGKRVTVFVEVKARFDEDNNLRWAGEMEKAGVRILYSLPGLKVHAKIALVKRRSPEGRNAWYGYLGTGNFNERTASLYCDHGLLTRHEAMTRELGRVFAFLEGKKPKRSFAHLLVAQFNMQPDLLTKLDREIAHARAGKAAKVIIKLNSLEERTMIDKLCEAGRAGVRVELIVRGICCLSPDCPGWSDNVRVYRLVDRYLEHARVFYFLNDGKEEFYLSSADWMNRNLHHRIEVGFPVYQPRLREEFRRILALQLADRVKLCRLDRNGNNIRLAGEVGTLAIRAQAEIYGWLQAREAEAVPAGAVPASPVAVAG